VPPAAPPTSVQLVATLPLPVRIREVCRQFGSGLAAKGNNDVAAQRAKRVDVAETISAGGGVFSEATPGGDIGGGGVGGILGWVGHNEGQRGMAQAGIGGGGDKVVGRPDGEICIRCEQVGGPAAGRPTPPAKVSGAGKTSFFGSSSRFLLTTSNPAWSIDVGSV